MVSLLFPHRRDDTLTDKSHLSTSLQHPTPRNHIDANTLTTTAISVTQKPLDSLFGTDKISNTISNRDLRHQHVASFIATPPATRPP
jgi:hypothetical protein